jgi:amidase/aspartyl-tRNA(Asn)/glutamyl-tRNA(Gln) amidotransferase subunit A
MVVSARNTFQQPGSRFGLSGSRASCGPAADKPIKYISPMIPDLIAARGAVLAGRSTASQLLELSLAAADSDAARPAFIRRFDAMARATAQAIDAQYAAGAPLAALAGLAVSVKDLFDVQGQPTTAGSRVLANATPAAGDSEAVARLRAAGAALVGHTHMTEFAFSGVGLNPHHPPLPNPVTAAIDATPRIPGGSTSGGAVSVATGAAWAALGSDTGGSIRIPAALQGLVGYKNTARLTPAAGCIPLSTTLDTVCAITRTVRDAITVHQILAQRPVRLCGRPLHLMRLAVPTTVLLDNMDTTVTSAFQDALSTLRAAGARIEEIELREVAALSQIQGSNTFAAAESWTAHRERLSTQEAEYDPRVASRMRRGAQMSAADYIELVQARGEWIRAMQRTTSCYDALLSPTVPVVAPPMAELQASDAAFFYANAMLLRNPAVVNMLDGCAVSLPCHHPNSMPVGLMVWSHALQDDAVLDVALTIESTLRKAEH